MIDPEMFKIENGVLTAYLGEDSEVSVPEGVHTIGDGVFKGMAWLLKVTLPTTVKKIGDGAFKGCRKLCEINLPEGLESIGEYAFHRCHDLKEMLIPSSVSEVGGYAFLYCDSVQKVTLEGVRSLKKATFSHNMSLREISLNKDMDFSNFSDEVFEGCVCLHKIALSGENYEVPDLVQAMSSGSSYPDIIKAIAKSVFHSLQIEDGVLQSFNINLKNITLPEGITAIGKSCFFDKKGIVSISFPKTLKEIRANAFLNCVSLEEVNFRSGDIDLDDKAFRGCCNLKRVNISGDAVWLREKPTVFLSRIRDQILGDFYISGNILVRYLGEEEQIKIPEEVEIIGEKCFFGNERLKVVTCPENLKEIREEAFSGCVTLQNVNVSDKLKRIGREAFAECKKLLKIGIPDTLEYIGEYAFRRCFSLPVFDHLPENAEIHPYAFYKAKNFAAVEERLKKRERELRKDFVWYDKYRDDTYIKPYAYANKGGTAVLSLTGVKRIGKYAFASCADLVEVNIDAPDCVIEQEAFSRCPNLKKVRLNVKELGKGIFSYCRSLKEVSLTGVSVLPEASFAGCVSLKSFEAKELTRMDARCFDECTCLDHFDFSGIKTIGERAFERCDSLKTVTLDKVEVKFHAFGDSASLEEVSISPDTVLKSAAFFGCTNIHTVEYDSERYSFDKFYDSLNHVGNPYPERVREVMAGIWSCFDIRDRKMLAGYSGDATRVTIPCDIEEIGQDVFRDHIRLEDLNIPASVKLFGSHAFSQTRWLDEEREKNDMVVVNNVLIDGTKCRGHVVIPDSVKRIAGWAFAGNIDITGLTIPSDKLAIESLSFRNCLNLKKITDHDGKRYSLINVSNLKEAGYPDTVKRIFEEAINCFKLDKDGILIESTGNIKALTFPEGIKSVGDGVYKDCHLLESIRFSTDTKAIGRSAFESSKWLKTVENAGAVESIGSLAFSGCQSLEHIDLSDALITLGSRCFEHCSSLKEIKLSANLKEIPERAFFRCKSLTELRIPGSVQVIGTEAFAFCDGLKDVYVHENTVISEKAFAHCDGINIQRYS